jgi:hypothetical protein
VERLLEAIRPDTSEGEAPEIPRYEAARRKGSTLDVDYWTSREAVEVMRSHVNFVVPDTKRREQSAAYYIDKHNAVHSLVKNAGLGFAIPYLHKGQPHDYMPDFIIQMKSDSPVHMILETKGYDPLEEVKREAAERWVAAVNADGTYGRCKTSTDSEGQCVYGSERAGNPCSVSSLGVVVAPKRQARTLSTIRTRPDAISCSYGTGSASVHQDSGSPSHPRYPRTVWKPT